jgi:purine-nucleoside phosphorylase
MYLPLMDYDPDPQALINARSNACPPLPKKGLLAFLGTSLDNFAQSQGLEPFAVYPSITKDFPLYVLSYQGEEIALMQAPLGAPAVLQNMEWMIQHGVETIMETGACGALEEIEENAFIVPMKALRDEGASYKYQPPAPWIELDPTLQRQVKATLEGKGLEVQEAATWTTDAFYRETPKLVQKRKDQGCQVVDMECSALAACAKFYGVNFAALFYTGDSLANLEAWDHRTMGADAREIAIELCLDCLHDLP